MGDPRDFGGQSMVADLRRVLVARPEAVGWADSRNGDQDRLGYAAPPDPGVARSEHDHLRSVLRDTGADVLELTGGRELTMDAIYVHDASLVTDHGAILLRMGKEARREEPAAHGKFYEEHGVPVLGTIRAPATAEGGDLVWLDDRTLLAGRGYRTNGAGLEQLRGLLSPHGVAVLEAPLPHGGGPAECLHLMSLMSMLDPRTAVVDLAWLAVETVELLRERGIRLIEMDPAERQTQGCNVLAMGERRLVALADNPRTNQAMRDAGFQVTEVAGTQISHNGHGGPTCLTRPLLRRR